MEGRHLRTLNAYCLPQRNIFSDSAKSRSPLAKRAPDPEEISERSIATAALYPRADLKTVAAFVSVAAPVERILTHIGESQRPPPIAPARGPPAWADATEAMPDWDLLGQSEPDFEFDQRIGW